MKLENKMDKKLEPMYGICPTCDNTHYFRHIGKQVFPEHQKGAPLGNGLNYPIDENFISMCNCHGCGSSVAEISVRKKTLDDSEIIKIIGMNTSEQAIYAKKLKEFNQD